MKTFITRICFIQFHLIKLYLKIKFSRITEQQKAVKLRETFERLGPLFVKLGQILSTRYDLISPVFAKELSALQDNVKPFSGAIAKEIIEQALQKKIGQVFSEFNIIPIAAASIAQVHEATLIEKGEKKVIIKVLRPHIHAIVKMDLSILKQVIFILNVIWRNARQFKPKLLLLELQKIFTQELNLTREATAAQQLKRHFFTSSKLRIPEVYWEFTRDNILVMEKVSGISLYNQTALLNAGFTLQKVAEAIIDLFFCQVFHHGYFHADMHPGNIFVADHSAFNHIKMNPSLIPSFIVIDFGMMGTLSALDQMYLAENFKAIFNRDYRAIAELHKASGWLDASTRLDEFEEAVRYVLEPILERSLEKISFSELILKLIQTAIDYKINIQPQFILLQKTLLNIEGIARNLCPQLNIWQAGQNSLRKYRNPRFRIKPLLNALKMTAPFWVDKLHQLPMLLQPAIFEAVSPSKVATSLDKQYYQWLNKRSQPTGASECDGKLWKKDVIIGFLIGLNVALICYLFL